MESNRATSRPRRDLKHQEATFHFLMALLSMILFCQCVAQTIRSSSQQISESYDWPLLVRITSAKNPVALEEMRARKTAIGDTTFRLLWARLYQLTGDLPHGSDAGRMIPRDESDFNQQYALGLLAMGRAEEGTMPRADAETVALLADSYFGVLPKLLASNPEYIESWARMRWWASGHPDMGEDIEAWDKVLRQKFGGRYDAVLKKVSLQLGKDQ